MVQATDGKSAAGRPTVEIDGKHYRMRRHLYRRGTMVKVVDSDDGRQVMVEVYEPVGER